MERIDTDYLIVGAGAAGMAFADTLLSETDARIVIVDRRDHPGGHWNDAYSFVRLHQPAAFYGVNSRPLGQPIKEAAGLNAGLTDLVSGPEIVGYFGQLMNQRFLPSGRVLYFPMSEMLDDDKFESLLTGTRTHRRVVVKCKRVDATYADTAVPVTHPPKYRVTPEAECVPLNRLAQLRRGHRNYVVVGSGKTGIDACLWLLGARRGAGVDPLDRSSRCMAARPCQHSAGRRVLRDHLRIHRQAARGGRGRDQPGGPVRTACLGRPIVASRRARRTVGVPVCDGHEG